MDTQIKLNWLISQGLSQEVIAARAGLKQPTISRILSGKQKNCLYSTANAIDLLYREVSTESAA